jgi:hypothetical protein
MHNTFSLSDNSGRLGDAPLLSLAEVHAALSVSDSKLSLPLSEAAR